MPSSIVFFAAGLASSGREVSIGNCQSNDEHSPDVFDVGAVFGAVHDTSRVA